MTADSPTRHAADTAQFAAGDTLHSTLSTSAFASNARYLAFARRSLPLAWLLQVLFLGMFAWLHIWQLALLGIINVLIYAWCNHRIAQRQFRGIHSTLVIHGLLHSAVVSGLIGLDSGFHFFSWLLIPLVAACAYNTRTTKIVHLVIVLVGCIGTALVFRHATPKFILEPQVVQTLYILNLVSCLSLTAFLSYLYAETVASFERRLHRHASTDPLTGLRNRRRIISMAHESMMHAQLVHSPLSMILCDIDHFKNINDQFGHPTGDDVLMTVADCLRAAVRRSDQVARWGGEEFLILLPECSLQAAQRVAENMQLNAQQQSAESAHAGLHFTLSFGVAEWNRGHEEFDAWVARADAALYDAKLAGRDCIRSSETPPLQDHTVDELLSRAPHPLAQNPAFHATISAEAHKTQALSNAQRSAVMPPKR